MAEISEVLEEFGDNTKKVLKDKRFWLVALGVGAVALFVGYTKKGTAAEQDTTAYEAIGYAGYPQTGGGSGEYYSEDNSAYYESLISEYQSSISDIQSQYETDMAEMASNVSTLSDRLISSEEMIESQQYQIQLDKDLAQMKANSELYNALTKPEQAATREALHAENLAIAEKYGWTFDSSSGNYFDGDSVVYMTSGQQAKVVTSSGSVSTTKSSPSASVSYQNNSAYSESVAKAVTSGTTATTPKTYASVNGKAPSGLSTGDTVVTQGGTYKITGVNSDGSYQSEKVSDTTKKQYEASGGTYSN